MTLRVERTVRSENELGDGGGRAAAFSVFVLLWVALLGWRLFDLQVRQHEHYAQLAQGQQQTVVELDAPRGAILDAEGRELAVSVQVQSIYANPREVRASGRGDEVTERLIAELDLDAEEAGALRRRLRGDGTFVWVRRKLDVDEAGAIGGLDLPGVHLLEESRRDYPMGSLASHVLGYVGTDNVGLAGLEYAYDDEVAGRSARRRVLRDASGTRFVAPWSLDETPRAGGDLVLTLDAALQHIAERALAEAVERHQARAGILVILDARDASVLALANVPTFDPNRFQHFDETQRRNRAVADAYEPGSTFKMVTAAAALETLAVRPDDRFDCEMGATTIGDIRIRDHKPFGVLTFREVLARSSNVGTIKAAMRVGEEPMHHWVRAFGFGADSGIDLGYENSGLVRDRSQWNRLATAYASFGHGLSVSPIQMANAYAALASGVLHHPRLVRGLRTADGFVEIDGEPGRPLGLSPATRKDLIRLLEGVVAEGGTGAAAAIPGYRVAGKTGTAQKSDSSGYSEKGRLASFVGIAPAGQPRLVALVMIDEPRGATGGGVVAAPVFREVVEAALLYLGIPPDRDVWERRSDFLALRMSRPDVPEPSGEGPVEIAALRGGGGR